MRSPFIVVFVCAFVALAFQQLVPSRAVGQEFLAPTVHVTGKVETFHADDPPRPQDYLRIEIANGSPPYVVPPGSDLVLTSVVRVSDTSTKLLVDGAEYWHIVMTTSGTPSGVIEAPRGMIIRSGQTLGQTSASVMAVYGYLVPADN